MGFINIIIAMALLSPHKASVPHVQISKDAKMLLSTSVLLSPGKVKVLNWEQGTTSGPGVREELLKPGLWVAAAAGEKTSFSSLHSNQTQLVLLHYTQPGSRVSSQSSNLSLAVRLPHSWLFS